MGSYHVPSSISRTSSPFPVTTKSQDISVLSARQLEIMNNLDMDQGLVGIKGSRPSLETSWKRYITITKAISKVGDANWDSGRKPSDGEIIGVYLGKSAYYDQLRVFHHIRGQSDMFEWLGRDLDVGNDDESSRLWGYYKRTYNLRDLEKWLERKQKEARADLKGKKKARSRKGKGDDDDSSSSTPPKKSHKKSVGSRK
jgi:hypothetical protein